MPTRIAVLASGRGTNLRALLEYLDRQGQARGGDVVFVASDRQRAGALDLAAARGIEARSLDTADARDHGLLGLLTSRSIDLVVLAGYLRLVPAEVVSAYAGRMVNVHPALLPAFGGPGMYGEHVHRAVLAAGARVTGVTVHFVDERYDRGAIVAQWPVPVFVDDTEHTLAARVLRVEHCLFPRVVDAVAGGRVALDAHGCARGVQSRAADACAFALQPLEDSSLARTIDHALAR